MKRLVGAPQTHAGLADPVFAQAVIEWQRRHGRHDLPWQRTTDPYRIWLSEIMLQQTQVATVIPYYRRFLERFPTVRSLADADIADIMGLWSGLGYYSRARNLHRCAQRIRDEYDCRFPTSAETLATLPGIGRSTAAAIAAFAFGQRAAILDGNVKRVFCRVFGIDGDPGTTQVEQQLWARAEALLPERHIEAYTQGLMDLGATVCTRSRPRCETCFLSARCVARDTDRVAELPARRQRKPLASRNTDMIVVLCGRDVLLERRAAAGIWGGLLSLPEIASDPAANCGDQIAAVASAWGSVLRFRQLDPVTHTFTHFKLHIRPWLVQVSEKRPIVAEAAATDWYRLDGLADAGLPAPVRKLLQQLTVESATV